MFDIKRLQINHVNAEKYLLKTDFFDFLCKDIIDRLSQINCHFKEILLINPLFKDKLESLLKYQYPNSVIHYRNFINDTFNISDKKFDLIIFPIGLHWISNVQLFLKNMHSILEKNGIFFCNFPGAGTLLNLRLKLIELESRFTQKHSAHISPFIQLEHVTPLLQQAGFGENIIDMESIELQYDTALGLMKALKNIGESNALENTISYTITKSIYNQLKSKELSLFMDVINLITFVSAHSKGVIIANPVEL